MKSHNAPMYVDIEGSSLGNKEKQQWDMVAKDLLTSLKEEKMLKVLDKSKIISYDIRWGENGVDSHSSKEHHLYVDRFCQDFFQQIKCCIEISIKKGRISSPNDKLFEDVAQHSFHCQQLCSSLFIKSEPFRKVMSNITNQSNSPLVIHGQQGSGKTSLVAMAASACSSSLGPKVAVIVRFIGLTNQSAKIHQLLRSLCHQLSVVFELDSKTVSEVRWTFG